MITRDDIDRVRGGTAYDREGSKLGKVGEVYLDNDSGEPAWVTVATGLFGTRQSFVPLDGANLDGDDLRLSHSKSTVKDAPNIGDDESLTPDAEDQLYRHYGVTGHQGSRDGDRDRDGTPDQDRGGVLDGVRDRDRDGVRDKDEDRDGVRDQDEDRDRGHRGAEDGVGPAVAAGVAGGGGAAGGAAVRGRADDQDRDSDADRGVDTGRDSGRRGSSGPRLRKHTVTEMQTITVPVEKEVYTLEDEDGPVYEAQRDTDGRETGSRHGRTDE